MSNGWLSKQVNEWTTLKSGSFEKDFEVYSQMEIVIFTINIRSPSDSFQLVLPFEIRYLVLQ